MAEKGKSKYKSGDSVVAPNGYRYIYMDRDGRLERVLYHHYVGFKKYGRWPRDHERVVFVDGDRRNLKRDNIEYRVKNSSRQNTLVARQKAIKAKIADLQGEYAQNAEELKNIRENGE